MGDETDYDAEQEALYGREMEALMAEMRKLADIPDEPDENEPYRQQRKPKRLPHFDELDGEPEDFQKEFWLGH